MFLRAGAESLATMLKTNAALTNLDLSVNSIGPAGAESLVTALKTNTTFWGMVTTSVNLFIRKLTMNSVNVSDVKSFKYRSVFYISLILCLSLEIRKFQKY